MTSEGAKFGNTRRAGHKRGLMMPDSSLARIFSPLLLYPPYGSQYPHLFLEALPRARHRPQSRRGNEFLSRSARTNLCRFHPLQHQICYKSYTECSLTFHKKFGIIMLCVPKYRTVAKSCHPQAHSPRRRLVKVHTSTVSAVSLETERMNNMSFVTLEKVYKRYTMGDVTIEAAGGISFDIEKGELAVIVGPSGSGKTTVLNILGGMDTCDEGRVCVDGKEIENYTRKDLIAYRRSDIGFVFQFYNLIPNLTAKENVELAAQITKDFIPAEEILEEVGLGERLDNFPAQLSGGEQQRVAIARALAKQPKLLLCDEPTGALDYNTGKMILKLLQDTCRKQNMTVVIVTHNTAITPMADKMIHLRGGIVTEIVQNPKPLPVEEIEW